MFLWNVVSGIIFKFILYNEIMSNIAKTLLPLLEAFTSLSTAALTPGEQLLSEFHRVYCF